MTVEENRRRVDDESDWFDEHRGEIIKGHKDEWVVIRDHRVWGYFPTRQECRAFMKEQGVEFGDYINQPCRTIQEELSQNLFATPLPGGRHVTKLV
jgi:hypothetical protein